ncbi:MAG TPA: hypothetical protein VGR94_06795 [Candidatus Acidoferrales bacterium]|nr:hypothetical protein [Candidatus Acidoferrales bacterium]HEV2499664.1 hypothetical protein [Terriglobia bacterium]
MRRREFRFVRHLMWIAMGATLTVASGCNFGSQSKAEEGSTPVVPMTQSNRFNPTGASVCLQQMIKNPPEPFHLSFAEKSSAQDASSVEADVTPATIDYTKHDTSAGQTSTDTKHLARAQVTEMEIDFDLMKPVPWHGELVAAQDAAKSAGAGSVNGYNAIKYSIDTANEPAAQKATFLSLMAVKDYKIVGSAWVTSDTGCLVKYAIDFEQDQKNGSVKKTHFEGDVTKR